MDEKLTYTYEFIDTSFDLKSKLPENSNQCYGKDVAEQISHLLMNMGNSAEVIEEDWGWSVITKIKDRGQTIFAIYPWGFLDDLSGEEEYLWRVRLIYEEKKKFLGLLKIYKQSMVPADIADNIKSVIVQGFNKFIRMEQGLVWR